MEMKNRYSTITDEEFDGVLLDMAKENIDEVLRLPGVYEIISEHFNNEVLDRCLDERNDRRRDHLKAVIANIAKNGFLCQYDAPYI